MTMDLVSIMESLWSHDCFSRGNLTYGWLKIEYLINGTMHELHTTSAVALTYSVLFGCAWHVCAKPLRLFFMLKELPENNIENNTVYHRIFLSSGQVSTFVFNC